MRAKAILVNREQAEALLVSAELLRRLRAVEKAHALGDEEALDAMFAGVDPVEVALTEGALHALYVLWRSQPDIKHRGGSEGEQQTSWDGTSATSPAPPSAPHSPVAQASAPVIPLDTYSRRIPCA